jgi:uncharacterized membrane protein YhaH (DUF805 family)
MSSNVYAAPTADLGDGHQGGYSEVAVYSLRGRIGRLRYLAYSFAYVVPIVIVIGGIGGILLHGVGLSQSRVITIASYILNVSATFVLGVRRTRDMGLPIWAAIFSVIPIVNLYWLFKGGTPGQNQYGLPPPPNSLGVKIVAVGFFLLCFLGIAVAIVLPSLLMRH